MRKVGLQAPFQHRVRPWLSGQVSAHVRAQTARAAGSPAPAAAGCAAEGRSEPPATSHRGPQGDGCRAHSQREASVKRDDEQLLRSQQEVRPSRPQS